MDVFGFIFGILALVTVMSIGIVGIGVFGLTKIVQTIADHITGRTKAPKRVAGQKQPAAIPAAQAPKPTQQPATPPRPKDYEYLDVDSGATSEHIVAVMRAYEPQRVIGFYASEVIRALTMADLRKQALFHEIDKAFSPNSISWDHFATTANEALGAILRNCALLGNRVQAFDVDDYERMEQFYRTGGEMTNGKQDPARIQRWEILRKTKDEMNDIRSANENLLLELDKLSQALSAISQPDSADESSRIAQEVSRLAEETKFYR